LHPARFAALLRDMERASLEAGLALRRIYSAARGDELLSQLAPVGFVELPDCAEVEVGGVSCRPIVCDLGPDSVAGWLSGSPRATCPWKPPSSTKTRASSCSTAAASRSPSSSATCWATCANASASPSRARRSCGTCGATWTGGSNVVEVAVSGLRRKLGDRAAALETVRGVGYRLQRL
jgi:hypothetical protein